MPPKPVPKKQPQQRTAQKKPATQATGRGVATATTKTSVTRPTGATSGRVGVTPAGKKAPTSTGRGVGGVARQPGKSQQQVGGTGGGKKQQVVAGGAKKQPIWTEKDTMARRIQTAYRGYRCRKLLGTLQKKKKEYEDMMDKLEKEAFLHMVKMEQERMAKIMEREAEMRRKRQEEINRVKKFLEAAFDGDCEVMQSLLNEVAKRHSDAGEGIVARYQHRLVECTDANKNTPLSEAAAGGDPEALSFLMSRGAQPNSKGQFGRTPLYRAAFGGHTEAVNKLLSSGADPRIYADDGALPVNVASGSAIEEMLKEWNIEETEKLIKKLDEETAKRREKDENTWKNEEEKLQADITTAEKEHTAKQKELKNAHVELNKRIYEHDKCVLSNNKPELTLKAVQDAEDHLEICKLKANEAKEKLQMVKLKLRMKRKEFIATDEDVNSEDDCKVDVVVRVKELDDVLMKDVGNKIDQSGKWPMVIDPGRQCATFLKYRDTNYFNVLNPRNMEPDTIRMGLLGAIRYGKFMVLDLHDIEDIWEAVVTKFNQVKPDLLTSIMNKTLIKDKKYLDLVKKSDGEEYSESMFLSARTHNFKLIVLTQLTTPPQHLLEQMYTIKIHISDPLSS